VAVASAVGPVEPCSPAIASHLLQHRSRRQETLPPPRAVLERFGPFFDLELGEDAVFNARVLEAGLEIGSVRCAGRPQEEES
jgi:hypothetical protein